MAQWPNLLPRALKAPSRYIKADARKVFAHPIVPTLSNATSSLHAAKFLYLNVLALVY